jgi:hypothetical protein
MLVAVAGDAEIAVRIAAASGSVDGADVCALSVTEFEGAVPADERDRLIAEFRRWSVDEKRRRMRPRVLQERSPSVPARATTVRRPSEDKRRASLIAPWQRRFSRFTVGVPADAYDGDASVRR